MKKRITTRIRRILSLCLVLAMMLTGTSVYAATVNANNADSTDEQEYGMSVTYNLETGEITYGNDRGYTLDETDIIEISGREGGEISPQGIVGGDDRVIVTDTTAFPYSAICYVESKFQDGYIIRGTGALVYKTVMLTAGDVVYSHNHGGWATSVMVIPALNSDGSNRPYGTAHATNLTSNVQWTENKAVEWDWAIVDLDTSFNSWLGYAYNNNYTLYIGMKVRTIGYPQDKGYKMCYDINSISAASERYMKILCDTEYGDSGTPVMSPDTGTIVGINVTEHKENDICFYNGAVRINEDLCNRIKAHVQSAQQ